MFWGLIMEPGRCYTQKVKISFHVSMAALDISNSSDEPAQVMCVFEGRNYLLCTLNKKDKVQCPLDLNFETGSKVSFATNGKAHVHLTGYLTDADDDDTFVEDEVEEEEVSKKDKKRLKQTLAEGPPNKKLKNSKVEEEEEDSSSDSDFDLEKLVQQESGDEEESDDAEEEGVEEEEDEDEEEEVSSLSNEEAEDSEEEKEVKPKQNGITPLKKKIKQEQDKTAKEKSKKQDKKEKQQQQQQQPKQKKTVLKGGVIAQDLREGNGEPVKSGKFVHVYYEGRLKDNNKMFDSTTKGPGFSFRVGKGEVIKGWDIGLVGMKVGGKRRITCPPNVAYGPKGSPPVIPPNSTLVFDVELKKVS